MGKDEELRDACSLNVHDQPPSLTSEDYEAACTGPLEAAAVQAAL